MKQLIKKMFENDKPILAVLTILFMIAMFAFWIISIVVVMDNVFGDQLLQISQNQTWLRFSGIYIWLFPIL